MKLSTLFAAQHMKIGQKWGVEEVRCLRFPRAVIMGLRKSRNNRQVLFFRTNFSHFSPHRAHAARSESESGKNRTCRKSSRALLVRRGMIFIFNFVSISILQALKFFKVGKKENSKLWAGGFNLFNFVSISISPSTLFFSRTDFFL